MAHTLVLIVALLLVSEARAQASDSLDRDDLEEIEAFIGLPESDVKRQFGAPDEVGSNEAKDAVVWTYVVRLPGEGSSESDLMGYRQFAFWNGLVASVSTKWFSDEELVTHVYRSSLEYMGEGGRTIANAGNADPAVFTDSLRISRRGDNLWMVDMRKRQSDSQATLRVGDAGYHMCQEAMEMEARRIESKFGVDVSEFVNTNRTQGARSVLQQTQR